MQNIQLNYNLARRLYSLEFDFRKDPLERPSAFVILTEAELEKLLNKIEDTLKNIGASRNVEPK